MKMNDDTIKVIYDSKGIDGLCKAVKDYVSGKYWDTNWMLMILRN